MLFSKKPLLFDADSVGHQLRLAREQRGVKLEVVAKKLLIKVDYLKALENNDKTKLPAGVYANNFLREYARFLGLDYKSLLEQFNDQSVIKKTSQEDVFERQVVAKKYLIVMPALVRNLIIALVGLICLVYIGYLINKIFQAPTLVITQPSSDISVKEKQLSIVGQTEAESEVEINGQLVQVSKDGDFKKDIYLEPGLNTIVVSAKKKHSRKATIVRNVLFEENSPSVN